MKVLLDTHVWAWTLTNNTDKLSSRAIELIASAEAVFVSPLSVYEIGQKARMGKWSEMAAFIDNLPALVRDQGADFAQLGPEMCLLAVNLAWDHRDPFDRLLAATAIGRGFVFISVDAEFDQLVGVEGWLGRRW